MRTANADTVGLLSYSKKKRTRGRPPDVGAKLLAMEIPKQIVYRYNGDASTDEVERDILGNQEVPQQGSLVSRKEGNWKVDQVELLETVSVPKALPIYRVYLTSQF
jgi:hypothetical protein